MAAFRKIPQAKRDIADEIRQAFADHAEMISELLSPETPEARLIQLLQPDQRLEIEVTNNWYVFAESLFEATERLMPGLYSMDTVTSFVSNLEASLVYSSVPVRRLAALNPSLSPAALLALCSPNTIVLSGTWDSVLMFNPAATFLLEDRAASRFVWNKMFGKMFCGDEGIFYKSNERGKFRQEDAMLFLREGIDTSDFGAYIGQFTTGGPLPHPLSIQPLLAATDPAEQRAIASTFFPRARSLDALPAGKTPRLLLLARLMVTGKEVPARLLRVVLLDVFHQNLGDMPTELSALPYLASLVKAAKLLDRMGWGIEVPAWLLKATSLEDMPLPELPPPPAKKPRSRGKGAP